MSITGINDYTTLANYSYLNTSKTDDTSGIYQLVSQLTGDEQTSTESAADQILLSTQGKIYSRLQQLQTSDPEKFKETCSEIATRLDNISGSSSESLMNAFEAAAESGDISDLTITSTESDSTIAKSTLNQYYQKYTSTQSTDNSSTLEKLQTMLKEMGVSIT